MAPALRWPATLAAAGSFPIRGPSCRRTGFAQKTKPRRFITDEQQSGDYHCVPTVRDRYCRLRQAIPHTGSYSKEIGPKGDILSTNKAIVDAERIGLEFQ